MLIPFKAILVNFAMSSGCNLKTSSPKTCCNAQHNRGRYRNLVGTSLRTSSKLLANKLFNCCSFKHGTSVQSQLLFQSVKGLSKNSLRFTFNPLKAPFEPASSPNHSSFPMYLVILVSLPKKNTQGFRIQNDAEISVSKWHNRPEVITRAWNRMNNTTTLPIICIFHFLIKLPNEQPVKGITIGRRQLPLFTWMPPVARAKIQMLNHLKRGLHTSPSGSS